MQLLQSAFLSLPKKTRALLEDSGHVEPVNWEEPPNWFTLKQSEAFNSDYKVTAVVAGWQAGKTVIGPPWLKKQIAETQAEDYAVVSPTYPLLSKKVLPEFLKEFKGFGTHLKADRKFVFSEAGLKKLGRKGPVTVWFAYAENPDSLESATYGAVWADEPGQMPEGSHKVIMSRVAIHRGKVLYTSRPYEENWYKTLIWDRWHIDPDIHVVSFRSIDNPAFPPEEYERAKLTMPDWEFKMKYDGIFTRPAGAIYDCFDTNIHLCDPFLIPQNWTIYAGLDFGAVHTAGLFAAMPPTEDELVFFASYCNTGGRKSVPDHVKSLNDKCRRGEQFASKERYEGAIRAYGGARSEDDARAQFALCGFPVSRPGVHEVEVQIRSVYAALKLRRIRIFRHLSEVADEFTRYSREITPEGMVTKEIKDKSTFHRLDSVRALIASIWPYVEQSGTDAVRYTRRGSDDET